MSTRLSFRAYKHREQTPLPADVKLDESSFWYSCETEALVNAALESRYPGSVVYSADLSRVNEFMIMPAKAFVQGSFQGRQFGFCLQYKTILFGAAPGAKGGLVYSRISELNVPPSAIDYSGLPAKLWVRAQSGGLHFLVQLEQYTSYPGILMKDDATGEVYCYRPRQFIIRVPAAASAAASSTNAATSVASATSATASAATAAPPGS